MSTVATTMIHTRVPKNLRDEAKSVVNELGVSMSLVMEQALRNIVATKELIINKPLVPTPYLEKILTEVDKDIRDGNKDAFSPVFTNPKDMDDYLDNYIATCK